MLELKKKKEKKKKKKKRSTEKRWPEKLGVRQSAHVANIPLIIALRQGTLSCLPDDALGRGGSAGARPGASEVQRYLHDLFRHVSASFDFIYQRRPPGKGQSERKPTALAAAAAAVRAQVILLFRREAAKQSKRDGPAPREHVYHCREISNSRLYGAVRNRSRGHLYHALALAYRTEATACVCHTY